MYKRNKSSRKTGVVALRRPSGKVQELARALYDAIAGSESDCDPRVESRKWSRAEFRGQPDQGPRAAFPNSGEQP